MWKQEGDKMKELNEIHADLIMIYTNAIELSHSNNQVIGEKLDYYITLEQLEGILKEFVPKP